MKFLCDRNLGKLAKWLRILGYDTRYEASDRGFLEAAHREGRLALTRNSRLASGQVPEGTLLVRADRVHEQIHELLHTLSLKPDPRDRLTLCLRCNGPLVAASRTEAEEKVPAYVFQSCADFRSCPECGRIYWPGSHRTRMDDDLRRVMDSSRRRQPIIQKCSADGRAKTEVRGLSGPKLCDGV